MEPRGRLQPQAASTTRSKCTLREVGAGPSRLSIGLRAAPPKPPPLFCLGKAGLPTRSRGSCGGGGAFRARETRGPFKRLRKRAGRRGRGAGCVLSFSPAGIGPEAGPLGDCDNRRPIRGAHPEPFPPEPARLPAHRGERLWPHFESGFPALGLPRSRAVPPGPESAARPVFPAAGRRGGAARDRFSVEAGRAPRGCEERPGGQGSTCGMVIAGRPGSRIPLAKKQRETVQPSGREAPITRAKLRDNVRFFQVLFLQKYEIGTNRFNKSFKMPKTTRISTELPLTLLSFQMP